MQSLAVLLDRLSIIPLLGPWNCTMNWLSWWAAQGYDVAGVVLLRWPRMLMPIDSTYSPAEMTGSPAAAAARRRIMCKALGSPSGGGRERRRAGLLSLAADRWCELSCTSQVKERHLFGRCYFAFRTTIHSLGLQYVVCGGGALLLPITIHQQHNYWGRWRADGRTDSWTQCDGVRRGWAHGQSVID